MPLMLCPNCNTAMSPVNRQDVEFDMCPSCRGVWLDRGELEKLVAGTAPERSTTGPNPGFGRGRDDDDDDDHRRSYGDSRSYGDKPRFAHETHKKRRFDLFDIFD